MTQYRLLNQDGTFNILRRGLRHKVSRDLYHTLLATSWARLLLALVMLYFGVNALFAVGYTLCGPNALEGIPAGETFPHRVLDAFFFSVQTLATIGYGKITPRGLPANILVTIEALLGLLGVALATGLLFARFSRPTARVVFSRVAMISPHEGVPSLLFRMANARLNQIVEARVAVTLAKDEVTAEGERYRTFYDLQLERSVSPIFVLSWTVVHPINEQSPLKGMTREKLMETQAELIVTLTGIDETFAQTIHTRFSYTPDEIIWNGTFEDILTRDDTHRIMIDLAKIHQYSVEES
jgi:inward rectifier potassium channel